MADLHEKALQDFDRSIEYYSEEYQRGKEDLRFAMGEQWDENIRAERLGEGRPILTENRMIPYINQDRDWETSE